MIFDNPIHFTNLLFYFFTTIFFFTIGIHYFLKYPRYQNTFAKVFILLIVVLICANGVKRSFEYSEKIWPGEEERGLERALLNAAHNFAEKGFSSNYGLPDFGRNYYDTDVNGKLTRVPLSEKPNHHIIYKHEPPGSSWLTALFVKACGNGTLRCTRILSTITGSLALLFFAIMIYYALGPLKSTVLMFFVAIIPMTRNMIWTLHNHNYSVSIFLIQVGFLLYFFKKKREFKMSTAFILFILAFIQGWVSYEYIFLTCLSPIPFALLYSQLDKKEDQKRLFFAMLFPIIGFGCAIGLHIIQISLYYGSFMDGFNELFKRSATVFSIDKPAGWNRKVGRISFPLEYFFVYPRSWFFFIINFPVLLSVCLVLIWFKGISITIKEPINISLKWVSSRQNYFVILSAFFVTYLWIFIMPNAVAIESPHMARILFFLYFVCILTMLECIRSTVPNNQ